MLGDPSNPTTKGSKMAVDGDYRRVRIRKERRLHKDKTEGRPEASDEGAALELKYLGIDTAAVETENTREMEGVESRLRLRHDCGL